MPQDFLTELGRLAISAAVVAAPAVPLAAGVGGLVWWVNRRVMPRWRLPWRPRLSPALPVEAADFLYLVLCSVLFLLYPAITSAAAAGLERAGFFEAVHGPGPPLTEPAPTDEPDPARVRTLWGTLLSAPTVWVIWLGLRAWTTGRLPRLAVGELPARFALGVAAWAVATPAVFAVNLAANWIAERAGFTPDQHPLTHLTRARPADLVAFGAVVCFFTPLGEETLFRGLFVGWAAGRWYRPWALMLLAGGLALVSAGGSDRGPAAVGFVAVLAAGLFALQRAGRLRPRFPVRTACSVYATAALFAAAHSAVWPSPVPLFLLGLVLGYLCARTNGIAACVVLHGLFNAVSFVYLLRGGAG